jgi:hypothetical protein
MQMVYPTPSESIIIQHSQKVVRLPYTYQSERSCIVLAPVNTSNGGPDGSLVPDSEIPLIALPSQCKFGAPAGAVPRLSC